MDNIQKFYLTTVESVDFNNAAEETRKKINSWVESQTHGRVWEITHKKHFFFSPPLCVKPVLDTLLGASGVGEVALQRAWRRAL